MNFMQRAWRQIKEKKTKTGLLFITFFIIANFVVVGLGISEAADNAKIETRKKMNPVVQYKVNLDKLYSDFYSLSQEEQKAMGVPKIDTELVKKMLQDDRVKSASWFKESMAYANGIEPLKVDHSQNNNDDDSSGVTVGGMVISSSSASPGELINPDLTLHMTATEKMQEFDDGTYELLKGRRLTEEDVKQSNPVCIIEQGLAESNNLSVGDTIKMNLYSENEKEQYNLSDEENTIELQVVGIYKNNNELSAEMLGWAPDYYHPSNRIIMTNTAYQEKDFPIVSKMFEQATEEQRTYMLNPEETNYNPAQATVILNDPLDVEQFKKDYQQAETDYTMLDANDSMYKKLSKPLDTIGIFANFIVWIVMLNAVVILTLVSALTLKNREYEIGVLLSLGVSKVKVVGQLFLEMVIIAVLGFTLATLSGAMVSNQVGQAVLDMQVSQTESGELDDSNSFIFTGSNDTNYFNEISMDEVVSEYDASISPWIILQIYGLGLVVVFISILIPSGMIMRFNPKKILTNTN